MWIYPCREQDWLKNCNNNNSKLILYNFIITKATDISKAIMPLLSCETKFKQVGEKSKDHKPRHMRMQNLYFVTASVKLRLHMGTTSFLEQSCIAVIRIKKWKQQWTKDCFKQWSFVPQYFSKEVFHDMESKSKYFWVCT